MLSKDTPTFGRAVAVGAINRVLSDATVNLDERVAILKKAMEVAVKARDGVP